MPTNEFIVEQYLDTARTRVTEQFKDEVVFDRYLQLLLQGFQKLELIYKDLMQLRSLDTATGAQLDVIGNIVGQDRELIAADLFDFFGMQGALNAASMGDLNLPTTGGIFYGYGTDLGGNIRLDDDTYRLFIRAKIYKNSTTSTPEEFIKALSLVFDIPKIAIVSDGDGEVTVLFGRQLTSYERVLLEYFSDSQGYPSRLIPKTVGVRINFGEFQQNNYFGFADSPGAKGFGDINGTYGYGLGYGLNYGQSDYTNDLTIVYSNVADGSFFADGSIMADGGPELVKVEQGGYFATIY